MTCLFRQFSSFRGWIIATGVHSRRTAGRRSTFLPRRVRDKIAASKRKGLWVGGPVPLGYRCLDKKLEIVPDEAEAVLTIFTRYLELGSMGDLVAELVRFTQTRDARVLCGKLTAQVPTVGLNRLF
jgi:hypothetical protein